MKRTVTIDFKAVIFWAMAIGFVIMAFKSCGGGILSGLFGKRQVDTVSVVRDTIWNVVQVDTFYKPLPFKVENTITRTIYKTDTLESFEILPSDTAAIIERFFQKAYYRDTLEVQYGLAVVSDTVYRNRIVGKGIVLKQSIPEVNTTVTVNQKKNIWYVDGIVMGTQAAPLTAIGGGLSIKARNDKIYSAGMVATKEGSVYYIVGTRIPIRLSKQTN